VKGLQILILCYHLKDAVGPNLCYKRC